jgi:PAS domain-containing protein
MSHQRGSRRELSVETTALRKQVDDLRSSIRERHRVEAALRESEAAWRATVLDAPTGLLRLTPAGLVRTVNPAFLGRLGYASRGDLLQVGGDTALFATEDEGPRIVAAYRGGGTRFGARVRQQDGTVTSVVLLARPGQDAESGVTLALEPAGPAPAAGESAPRGSAPA